MTEEQRFENQGNGHGETPAGVPQVGTHAEQLTSALAHDLGRSLHLICGYADLLQSETSEPVSPKQKRRLEHIRHATQELLQTVETYRERIRALAREEIR